MEKHASPAKPEPPTPVAMEKHAPPLIPEIPIAGAGGKQTAVLPPRPEHPPSFLPSHTSSVSKPTVEMNKPLGGPVPTKHPSPTLMPSVTSIPTKPPLPTVPIPTKPPPPTVPIPTKPPPPTVSITRDDPNVSMGTKSGSQAKPKDSATTEVSSEVQNLSRDQSLMAVLLVLCVHIALCWLME